MGAVKVLSLIFIFQVIRVHCELSYYGDYSYDDEDVGNRNSLSDWSQISQTCNGFRQSPIDLNDQLVNKVPLMVFLQNFDLKAQEVEMTNDGQTVELRFTYQNGNRAAITGPAVKNQLYVVDSVHFHWGENDNVGSEHTVNGFRYPGEIHIVSYNSKYQSVQQARKVPDGLAVIGTFLATNMNSIPFELRSQAYFQQYSYGFVQQPNDFLARLPDLVNPNATVTFSGANSLSLMDVIKQNPLSSYYTYPGSLTTPDCEESVIWFVNRLPVLVSPNVLRNFRNIRNRRGASITRNYRSVQNLNDRHIYRFL